MPAGRRHSEVAVTELVLGGTVAAGLAIYLLFALIHPERF
jgi:K+-transporting ATPase KdpF subunit